MKPVELYWLCCISLETAISVQFSGCLHFHIIAIGIERALSVLHMLLFRVTLRWVHGIWKCWGCDKRGPVKQNFFHCTGWRCTFSISASCQAGLGMSMLVDSWALLALTQSLKHVSVWQSKLRHFTGSNVACTQCVQALSSDRTSPIALKGSHHAACQGNGSVGKMSPCLPTHRTQSRSGMNFKEAFCLMLIWNPQTHLIKERKVNWIGSVYLEQVINYWFSDKIKLDGQNLWIGAEKRNWLD